MKENQGAIELQMQREHLRGGRVSWNRLQRQKERSYMWGRYFLGQGVESELRRKGKVPACEALIQEREERFAALA